MNSKDFANTAASFVNVPTFYEYGGWGQTMTKAELDRLANLYPKNKPVNYNNVGKWGFDCICYIKGLLSGVTPLHHVNDYNAIKNCPIGDCTNGDFLNKLYDCVNPKDAPAGYGLATASHAAISLGGDKWIDANRNANQDGVQIHTTGIEQFTKAGKIPGIEYDAQPQPEPTPVVPTERQILINFVTWLVDEYLSKEV